MALRFADGVSVPLRASGVLLALVFALVVGPSANVGASVAGRTLWVARYTGPGTQPDTAQQVAVSPDGSRVFVTGRSAGAHRYRYATLAYDVATGATLWTARYRGPAGKDNYASAVVVSPDGSKVFVTGSSFRLGTGFDFTTVAYDADTGGELWVRRYDGPAHRDDPATALAVSDDGSRLFVTGWSTGVGTGPDVATVAYDTASGAQLWVTRYNGPESANDYGSSIAVSPDGSRVFVTGDTLDSSGLEDYLTLAYQASSGAQLWAEIYGTPGTGDIAQSVAVSPDGRIVFVTGGEHFQYATLAYDAATGWTLWVAKYSGPGNRLSSAFSMAVSPDGSMVFVTGESESLATDWDYATVAYDAATGSQRWVSRYAGPGHGTDTARSIAVSPDGSKVFVTGESNGGSPTYFDYATVAYDSTTGWTLWLKRYATLGDDAGYSVAVSPDNSRVFVTGPSSGDYATVAYAA